MKTQEIFNLFLQKGIEADLRGKEAVEKLLERKKKAFDSLSQDQKDEFDQEALTNPYMDSGIFNVSDDKEIKKILVFIYI